MRCGVGIDNKTHGHFKENLGKIDKIRYIISVPNVVNTGSSLPNGEPQQASLFFGTLSRWVKATVREWGSH